MKFLGNSLNEIGKIKYNFFLILMLICTLTFLSIAASPIYKTVVIKNSGQISLNLIAKSGYWKDIQDAINVAFSRGGGNVYIPAGTWNFVNVGESWTGARVIIPPGVSVFGAPTERDENGQVIEWKTVLVMPWEVPCPDKENPPMWFCFYMSRGPTQDGFRFSDIKLVGWRYFDYILNGEPNWTIPYDPQNPGDRGSETMYIGLGILDFPYDTGYETWGLINFRVDHCCFQDLAGNGVYVGEGMCQHNRHVICGVIDHCVFNNSYGDPGRLGTSDYEYRTLGYGIGLRRWACDVWESDFRNVIMRYNNYTIFIENNWFSKWRHCICVNDGLHIVVRYNVFETSYGVGDVDAHGSYAEETRPYAVGTRAMEIYNNTFKDPVIGLWDEDAWAINVRGGCAIITNNTLMGYTGFLAFNEEDGNIYYQNQCRIDYVYVWNNELGGAEMVFYEYIVLGGSVYYRAPNVQQDGFEYVPYQYPHPLTLTKPFT